MAISSSAPCRRSGEEYLTLPQRQLFDRIGIRRQVLETDPYGNFLLTGYDYGTARNWARIGLLYLQDGVWQGERILPEGWTKFVSTLAPAWKRPVYGGFFWINGDGDWNLPQEHVSGGRRGRPEHLDCARRRTSSSSGWATCAGQARGPARRRTRRSAWSCRRLARRLKSRRARALDFHRSLR